MKKALLPLPVWLHASVPVDKGYKDAGRCEKREHYFCMEAIGTEAIKAKETVPTNKDYETNTQTKPCNQQTSL